MMTIQVATKSKSYCVWTASRTHEARDIQGPAPLGIATPSHKVKCATRAWPWINAALHLFCQFPGPSDYRCILAGLDELQTGGALINKQWTLKPPAIVASWAPLSPPRWSNQDRADYHCCCRILVDEKAGCVLVSFNACPSKSDLRSAAKRVRNEAAIGGRGLMRFAEGWCALHCTPRIDAGGQDQGSQSQAKHLWSGIGRSFAWLDMTDDPRLFGAGFSAIHSDITL